MNMRFPHCISNIHINIFIFNLLMKSVSQKKKSYFFEQTVLPLAIESNSSTPMLSIPQPELVFDEKSTQFPGLGNPETKTLEIGVSDKANQAQALQQPNLDWPQAKYFLCNSAPDRSLHKRLPIRPGFEPAPCSAGRFVVSARGDTSRSLASAEINSACFDSD